MIPCEQSRILDPSKCMPALPGLGKCELSPTTVSRPVTLAKMGDIVAGSGKSELSRMILCHTGGPLLYDTPDVPSPHVPRQDSLPPCGGGAGGLAAALGGRAASAAPRAAHAGGHCALRWPAEARKCRVLCTRLLAGVSAYMQQHMPALASE